MTRGLALTLGFVLTLGSSSAPAYLKLGAIVNGHVVDATWKQLPIGYFVSDRPGNGVTPMDLQAASEADARKSKSRSRWPRRVPGKRAAAAVPSRHR